MSNCNGTPLIKLGGALHPSGNDYYCPSCGEQYRAEKIVIGAHMGTNQGPGQAGIPPEPAGLPEAGKRD